MKLDLNKKLMRISILLSAESSIRSREICWAGSLQAEHQFVRKTFDSVSNVQLFCGNRFSQTKIFCSNQPSQNVFVSFDQHLSANPDIIGTGWGDSLFWQKSSSVFDWTLPHHHACYVHHVSGDIMN